MLLDVPAIDVFALLLAVGEVEEGAGLEGD